MNTVGQIAIVECSLNQFQSMTDEKEKILLFIVGETYGDVAEGAPVGRGLSHCCGN